MLVPRRFLAQVYGLIAKLDSEGPRSARTADDGPSTTIADEWSKALLRRMVHGASPGLLSILKALSDQPESWLSTGDLAVAMGKTREESKKVGGTLSAFWRRIKGRYKLNSFPFERRDDNPERVDYRMDAETARLVKQFIGER